jgi:Ethanolamine utilization protein EutJ (predicted chaperonin)
MEQSEMRQMLEMMAEMKAQIGGLASRMDVNKAESEAVRKADEESMAKMERLLADNREIKADNAESKAEGKADKEEMMATIRRGQEEMIKAITGASQESTEPVKKRRRWR